jgi:hypothetical protein
MVGGLAFDRQADRLGSDRLGQLSEQADQRVVALDGDGRPVQGLDGGVRIGEGDQGVEAGLLGPRRHGRLQDGRSEEAAGVDQRLAAVQAQIRRHRPDRVVGHGQEDERGLVEDARRLGEAASVRDRRPERLAARGSRLATATTGQSAAVSARASASTRPPRRCRPMAVPSDLALPGFRAGAGARAAGRHGCARRLRSSGRA